MPPDVLTYAKKVDEMLQAMASMERLKSAHSKNMFYMAKARVVKLTRDILAQQQVIKFD